MKHLLFAFVLGVSLTSCVGNSSTEVTECDSVCTCDSTCDCLTVDTLVVDTVAVDTIQ